VNHEFCVSIYTSDPDGNTVEFCGAIREFTDEEKIEAHALLGHKNPPMDKDAQITIHPPTNVAVAH
jgi:catechol-2,3-dioxygenase